MEKEKRYVINGDPLTYEKKECHVDLHWYSRIFYDQLMAYKDESEVNEHANENKGWYEYLETISGEIPEMDIDVRWWEYKGISCEMDKKSPLIVCFNENYTSSWQHVADKNGLIVVTFEYHRNFQLPAEGMGAMGFGPSDREIRGYKKVVDRVIEKYNVDKERVYLNGLSYGDMSALCYAKAYGDTLAGIVLMNGPSSPYNLKRYDLMGNLPEIPSMQLRSESDLCVDGFPEGISFDSKGNIEWLRYMRSQMALMNRDLWLNQNKAKDFPIISSCGKRVYLKYEGENAPVIYNENYHRSHLPPIDFSQVMWDNLYNVYKRDTDGNIVKIGDDMLSPDSISIALAVGSDNAYIDFKVKNLSGKCYMLEPHKERCRNHLLYGKLETEYPSFYAPIDILKEGFGLAYYVEDVENITNWSEPAVTDRIKLDDSIIHFIKDGKEYQLLTNTCAVLIDGHVSEMERPPLVVDGNLMIPIKEFAELMGLHCSVNNDVAYVTDHEVEIGLAFTRIMREEILCPELKRNSYNVECVPTNGGSYEVSATEIPFGETLIVTVTPNEGYEVDEVIGYMNGLEIPVKEVQDKCYYICNVLGDVTVEVTFIKEAEV